MRQAKDIAHLGGDDGRERVIVVARWYSGTWATMGRPGRQPASQYVQKKAEKGQRCLGNAEECVGAAAGAPRAAARREARGGLVHHVPLGRLGAEREGGEQIGPQIHGEDLHER